MTHPNKDNPAEPSKDAQTPEQIHQTTQDNQDWNRPEQDEAAQQGQKQVNNDSGSPGYGSGEAEGKTRRNGLGNGDDRVDDLGDSE